MKYKPKIYAQILAEILSDKKNSAEEKRIVDNFLALLEHNQDINKADEILQLTEALLLKKMGNKKVVLETARKIDAKEVLKHIAERGDIIEEKINPALVAGVKIVIDQSKQLDLSLVGKLERMFK
jgi:F0F1-type ATP synthase delta subunit